MPGNKVTINLGGKKVQATPIDVNQSGEKWNDYLLEDGTAIRMKLVLKKVLRVDGQFDAEGNPLYVMQSTNVTSVSAPDQLKKGYNPPRS